MARFQPTEKNYKTKQELVYQALRNGIMHGDLKPGQRLVIEEIAERLEVSPIPVREALQALQSERLIENTPHVGATVAQISQASIDEIFALMEGLETVATRIAAHRLTPESLQSLKDLLVEMDEAVQKGDHGHWADLNTEFHRTIGRMTAMPMLQEMTELVLAHWDRIRRHFFKGVFLQRIQRAQHEHHEIVRAMEDRNELLLESLVKTHTQGVRAAYIRYLEERAS